MKYRYFAALLIVPLVLVLGCVTQENIRCTDSDGESDNYYVSGSVIVEFQSGGRLIVDDYCLSTMVELANQYDFYQDLLNNIIASGIIETEQLGNANILIESYCPSDISNLSSPFHFEFSYECPNGCSEGACI